MAAPPGIREERKVRAPQGRVVRNADCPRFPEAEFGGKESATEKIPPRGIP